MIAFGFQDWAFYLGIALYLDLSSFIKLQYFELLNCSSDAD
ncbi:hypothetical protein RchiOBHm_Chr3g0465891 [Rosa chinensis]|uniref:Uncharacterized protein n=1 Tax=Rosa chinensis TaxID=74649 RepID=A0A2P6R9U1_ROSCH|nr:hypothetical protein RchiOBHm_Chr3g0465891 [Rosa chinensis]